MEKSWKTIKNFLLLISEKGKGKEKEREGNINQLPLAYTPTGDQTCNLGLCPDWEFEPTTFWFIEQCPTNWASRASAWKQFLNRGSALCFIFILNVYLLVLERKRKGERERNMDLLFHLLTHSLVDSYMCPDRDWTFNFGVGAQCSNQLSYPARACFVLVLTEKTFSSVSSKLTQLVFFSDKCLVYFIRIFSSLCSRLSKLS